MPPVVLKLSRGGSAEMSDSGGRNSKHVQYIASHGALSPDQAQREANAAHIVYQATHGAKVDEEGARLIGNAATQGEDAARDEVRGVQGHQWRWVVSLRGDDAQRMGYTTAADWHRLAHEVVPQLASAIGIQPEDVRWVAAHHDPDPRPGGHRHPHLHVALWSKEPFERDHRLTRDELRACRRVVVKVVQGPLHTRLSQEKTALREALREAGVQTLSEALQVARELKGRGHVDLALERTRELEGRLVALANQMPGRGRASLAYLPAELQAEVRTLTDWLLKQPAFARQVVDYRETARLMTELYTQDPAKLAQADIEAYEDLRDRIGQSVVKAAAQLNQESRSAAALGVAVPDSPGGLTKEATSEREVVEHRGTTGAAAELHTQDPGKPAQAEIEAYDDQRDRIGQSTVQVGAQMNQGSRSATASWAAVQTPLRGLTKGLLRSVGQALSEQPRRPAHERKAGREGRSRDGRSTDGRGRD